MLRWRRVEGGFADSTSLRKLNAGERVGSADELLRWKVGGPGRIFRRQREQALFRRGLAEVGRP